MEKQTRLEEFDKYTGIEQMRVMVRAFGNCRESFLDRYSLAQLTVLYRVWLASDWFHLPDDWEERQVIRALKGIIPTWDDRDKATYPSDWTNIRDLNKVNRKSE